MQRKTPRVRYAVEPTTIKRPSRRKRQPNRGYGVGNAEGNWFAFAIEYDERGLVRDIILCRDENTQLITKNTRRDALEMIQIAALNTKIHELERQLQENAHANTHHALAS